MKTSLRPTGGPRAGSLKFAVVLAIPYSWAVSTVRGLASSGGCCSEQLNSGTHRACVAVVEQVGKSLSRLRTTDRCRTRLGPNGSPPRAGLAGIEILAGTGTRGRKVTSSEYSQSTQ